MNAFFAILLIVATWLIILTCTTWMGGWKRLQRHYRASIELPTRGPYIRYLYLGLPYLLPAWARVSASKQGIYLEPVFPATLFFKAILLPWNELTFSSVDVGWKFTKIEPRGAPHSVVHLFDDYFRELQSRFVSPEATELASSQDMSSGGRR